MRTRDAASPNACFTHATDVRPACRGLTAWWTWAAIPCCEMWPYPGGASSACGRANSALLVSASRSPRSNSPRTSRQRACDRPGPLVALGRRGRSWSSHLPRPIRSLSAGLTGRRHPSRRSPTGRVLNRLGTATTEIALPHPERSREWMKVAILECARCLQVVERTSPIQRHCRECRTAIKRTRSREALARRRDLDSEGRSGPE